MPSRASSVANSAAKPWRSSSLAAASGSPAPAWTNRFASATASGPRARIFRELLADVRQELLRREHLEDQPQLPGPDGVAGVAREQQLHGPHRPHSPGQPLRAAEPGHDPEIHLRLSEACLLARVDQVAGQRHLAAAAERVSVHGGDGRHGQPLQPVQHRVAALGEPPRLGGRHARHGRDVGTGHEGALSSAGQDQRARRAALHLRHHLAQLVERAGVEGVQHPRPVEGGEPDPVLDLEQHVLAGHGHRHLG